MSRSLIPNSTQVPDVILDEWMAILEGAELKVVLYVARRTFGFGKKSDRISIPQMAHGITNGQGEVLDRGTGLSERAIQEACNYLVDCGVLLRKRGERQNSPSAFAINLRWEGDLLDRKKWRSKQTSDPATVAPQTPQPLHPAKNAPCNEVQSDPATVAPQTPQPLHPQETGRDREQETAPVNQKTDLPPPGGANTKSVRPSASRRNRPQPCPVPNREEVDVFFDKAGHKALAEDFWDMEEQRGWTQGKEQHPLISWEAAARRFIRDPGGFRRQNRDESPPSTAPDPRVRAKSQDVLQQAAEATGQKQNRAQEAERRFALLPPDEQQRIEQEARSAMRREQRVLSDKLAENPDSKIAAAALRQIRDRIVLEGTAWTG